MVSVIIHEMQSTLPNATLVNTLSNSSQNGESRSEFTSKIGPLNCNRYLNCSRLTKSCKKLRVRRLAEVCGCRRILMQLRSATAWIANLLFVRDAPSGGVVAPSHRAVISAQLLPFLTQAQKGDSDTFQQMKPIFQLKDKLILDLAPITLRNPRTIISRRVPVSWSVTHVLGIPPAGSAAIAVISNRRLPALIALESRATSEIMNASWDKRLNHVLL
jgi:hypothetical protein